MAGGGEKNCLVHMRKNGYDDSYVVAEVEEARDGYVMEDIRAFRDKMASASGPDSTDKVEEIFKKQSDWEVNKAMGEAIQKELLQQYVQQNDLPAKYYKYKYGSEEPVSIF